ncbi:uncharacterized protein FFMR_06189 [Fusarium fujikuroi]|nr:uncharacterized protein FFMR_06189 [Fusarium fujikuroi]
MQTCIDMAGDNLPHARRSHNVQEPQRKCRQRAWPKPSDLHDNTATNTYTRRIVVFASWWLMLNTSRPSTRGSKGTAREVRALAVTNKEWRICPA